MKKLLLLSTALMCAACAHAGWGTSAADPVALYPTGTTCYANDVRTTPDGGVWSVIYYVNLQNAQDEYETNKVIYEFHVQHWDKDGNPSFAPEGKLISDYANKSWTVVSNYLTVDSEGNAIVMAMDRRNSNGPLESYTAYRISPTGEMLWGDEGKPISDPTKAAELVAMMDCIQLEDGSFVFAWIEMNGDAQNIHMQRLDKDGKKMWDESKVSILDEVSSNPHLVASGDNTCILVYSRTASQIFYARKLDFEGSSVWGKDVRIYRGGWGSIPVHTLLHTCPSGDGGVLIAWNDDRDVTNIESAFLSYVTPDGKLGFDGASEEGDVKLGYNGMRSFNVCAAPAADGTGFYTAWRETSPSQSIQTIRMQKVSKTGELLWDEDAVEIVPQGDYSIGYLSLQTAGETDAMLFYERHYSYQDQCSYAVRVNKDGEYVFDNHEIALSERNRKASALESHPLPGNTSWIYNYDDAEAVAGAKTTMMMNRFNIDGTFGIEGAGIADVAVDAPAVTVVGNAVYAAGCQVKVYNLGGALVAAESLADGRAVLDLPAGIYVADVDGKTNVKITIK